MGAGRQGACKPWLSAHKLPFAANRPAETSSDTTSPGGAVSDRPSHQTSQILAMSLVSAIPPSTLSSLFSA